VVLSDHPHILKAFEPIPSPLNLSQTTNDNASSVNQGNHRPVAQNLNITILEIFNPVAFTLKGTDQDQNDKLNYTILTEPVHGTIRIDPPTGAVIYNPQTYQGDAFTVQSN
jgi:Bacterial Ig domain